MRAHLQRVSRANVTVDSKSIGEINDGLLILLGVETEDDPEDIAWLVKKIVQMRIFPDESGHMNLDIQQIRGETLVVSQFTLHASTKKGNRPSFHKAAPPEKAKLLYTQFVEQLKEHGLTVATGEFGAMMEVSLVNDGPVTILLDSKCRE